MKDVYIFGSNDGIGWVEDQGSEVKTSSSQWGSSFSASRARRR